MTPRNDMAGHRGPVRWASLAWGLLPLIALAVMYAPVVPPMVADWSQDENASHGFLVPLISAFFLWRDRDALRTALADSLPRRAGGSGVSRWAILFGALLVVVGGLQYMLGTVVQELFLARASLIVVLAGAVLWLFGGTVMRVAALPVLYLSFMVPIPFTVYNAISFPLKLLVTRVSVGLLKLSGQPVLREGNVILFPNITLEVVEACSGMRSLVSLIAMGTAYAFIMLHGWWRRVIVIAAAVPIAIISNVLRVYVTGILARYFGPGVAEGFFHEFAGIAVFLVALAGLVVLGALLGRVGKGGSHVG